MFFLCLECTDLIESNWKEFHILKFWDLQLKVYEGCLSSDTSLVWDLKKIILVIPIIYRKPQIGNTERRRIIDFKMGKKSVNIATQVGVEKNEQMR